MPKHSPVCLLLAGALVAACGPKPSTEAPKPAVPVEDVANPTAAATMDATATIRSADGAVLGTVRFSEHEDRLEVRADFAGVPPGVHGFHLHAEGRCEGPDFTSAGGHFDPHGQLHGAPADAEHHGGDLGNVTIGADGRGRLELPASGLTVTPGPSSVVGRAVVLHANPDDFKTQPTGNAGARIGCGVVAAGG